MTLWNPVINKRPKFRAQREFQALMSITYESDSIVDLLISDVFGNVPIFGRFWFVPFLGSQLNKRSTSANLLLKQIIQFCGFESIDTTASE